MIANPDLPAYRYNPFDKAITKEGYDVEQMKTNRIRGMLSNGSYIAAIVLFIVGACGL